LGKNRGQGTGIRGQIRDPGSGLVQERVFDRAMARMPTQNELEDGIGGTIGRKVADFRFEGWLI
jgi:hypothetical protein